MGDGVVRCRLRIKRREMLEGRGGARAENVAAFVIFKDDHDDMRDPRNISRRSGAPRTRDDDDGDENNDHDQSDPHDHTLLGRLQAHEGS